MRDTKGEAAAISGVPGPAEGRGLHVAAWAAVLSIAAFPLGCGGEAEPASGKTAPEGEAAGRTAPAETRDASPDGGAGAAKEEEPRDEPPEGKRVVLIVVDTLRADRLGCYGYREQPVTPTMDRLASEGVLFERFHSASPWTGASFGSILTGVSPSVHGGGRRMKKFEKGGEQFLGVRVTPLDEKVPTLCEILSDSTCAAVVTNAFLHPSLGFARGFDHYDHRVAGLMKSRRADETTAAAIAWLREHSEERFFLMVHYFDPHMSYDPPKEYRNQFAKGPRGRIGAPFVDHAAARSGELDPSEAEQAFIRGLYNGEVRFVDDQIGALLAEMKDLGLLDDTWVALTADHGEEQFDHGSFDHGHRYEEEVTHVPLVIRAPGGEWKAGSRVPWSARHIDLAPTILGWLSVDAPGHMAGADLMPLMKGEEERHRPAYIEFNIYWKARSALFDGRYKIVRDLVGSGGWLYDLDEDPGEKTQHRGSHPRYADLDGQLSAVREQLAAESRAPGADAAVELPADVEESLRSLGYIH